MKKGAIPYMVIGGQAVLLYGEPRLTRDIDITLGMGVNGLDKIKKIIKAIGLKILVEKEREFVERNMVLPTIDKKSGIRVDFIFSFSSYARQAIERGKDIKLGRTLVKFASLEDVVIHKVIAGRARDLEDVKSILLKNPKYDSVYIEKWLEEFDKSLGDHFLKIFGEMNYPAASSGVSKTTTGKILRPKGRGIHPDGNKGRYMSKKNEMLEEYGFSKGKRGPVIPHKGKTRITIFIDTDILEWFKDEAEREGRGYQTEINQALRNYIKQDKHPIQDLVREAVREELKVIKKAS